MKLVYWPMKARGYAPLVLAKFGHVDLEWDKAGEWPAIKGKAPFGQLPILIDGEHTYAQSAAIIRIIARRAGLQGGSDHEYALNEMLIEEFGDIYNGLNKANYASDKEAGLKDFFENGCKTQLGYLEKLIGASGRFSSSRLLVGDVVMVCLFDILTHLEPTVLDAHPKLKAFFDANKEVLGEYAQLGMYYKRG